ncbi:ankyrin repeat domain-containing protein [Candidatus Jidaibacter acanthamoebae]|nr:ankyrin repeat domain-containing protein [Candidatus Jidaibacter acanthamoeba]
MQLSKEDIHLPNKYQYENLIFEGGGIKGFAYIGAIDVLGKENILAGVKRVAGTSAGAITALLLGLGYDIGDSRRELEKVFFESYNLGDTLLKWPLVLRRIRTQFGAESAEFFLEWAEGIVERKLGSKNATFKDAHKAILSQKAEVYKYMYFTGTNISTGYYEIFSHEHTPDMKIADAVRISMSIPLVFTAKRYAKPGSHIEDLYVDGGVVNNYPLHLFDERSQPNMKTLGFRVDPIEELAVLRDGAEPIRSEITGFISYAKALYGTTQNAVNNVTRRSDDKLRTVFIDITGVDTLSFKLSEETKEKLIRSGREATKGYLISRPDKLKTSNSRLERFDRKKIYEKACEIYCCEIGEDTAKIQYWFKNIDNLKTINKYVDRIKEHDRTIVSEIFTGAVDDKIKVVEITTAISSLKEIKKWDSSTKKASQDLKKITDLPLVKVESWKRQDYVELKAKKKPVSLELIEAVHAGNIGKTVDLLSSNISLDGVDKFGCAALHYAAEFGYYKIAETLLRNDPAPNINLRDNSGETALHRAALQGYTNIVRLLLTHNANIDVRSSYGATALHRAAYHGHKDVMAELIRFGSSINEADEIMQNTPLHWAVAHNHKEAAELLLKQGADTMLRNKEGKLASECAQSFEMKEIFRKFSKNEEISRAI